MERDEKRVLEQWSKEAIFEKSVAARKDGKPFVFFEGPPTANGMPHIGHAMTRVFKDVILRYKTMQGFYVPRRAGWDTQGLPVEIGVEKALGLKTKKDIEQYGIAKFNKACKESVWKYRDEWVKFSERLGFWIDYDEAYVTYESNYLESLWSVLKSVSERDLLYEDHKIVPWCPRCGTGLSSHELAQGYNEVTDISTYIKFKLPKGQQAGEWVVPENAFVVAWTTTPWTLPGNVALAVGEDIEYVAAKRFTGEWNNEGKATYDIVIVAKDFFEKCKGEPSMAISEPFYFLWQDTPPGCSTPDDPILVGSFTGADLQGLTYTPLFDISSTQNEQSHKIYTADFVTTTDGTGVVHTAVMYGEEDYKLGKSIGLPSVHTVDETGKFVDEVKSFAGMDVREEETAREIIGTIKAAGLLFKTQKFKHDYPFCWRCDSRVIYYGRKSWWIGMSQLCDDLLKSNDTVNWVPANLKTGRFGEWLREVKDWAFSRARYWGTPLPIWKCGDCEEVLVVGSVAELKSEMMPTKNTYILMRHGEAEQNVKNIISSDITTDDNSLTEKGKEQILEACQKLSRQCEKIDLIVSSDFKRARETAETLAECKDGVKIQYDERLREYNIGDFNGSDADIFAHEFPRERRFDNAPQNGERVIDVRRRMLSLINSLEDEHKGETIVIVSHATPLWGLKTAMEGLSREESLREINAPRDHGGAYFPNADTQVLTDKKLPTDEDTFLDLHRPYIDEIVLKCKKCEKGMRRVPELADVWFDSGAMPFAQWHYPMENAEQIDKGKSYPADYIVEAVDQTRGWFYTLLAVATLMKLPAPYKNVISLGHVLDERGKKMSKSRDNGVDPADMIEMHGADPFRWYFLTVNQPGEPKLFSEKDVITAKRNTLDLLWNSFVFWQTYADMGDKEISTEHVLDKWIMGRLHELLNTVTTKLDEYDMISASREIESFVAEDLSRWYIRRSRSRLKDGGGGTLREVLRVLSIIMAPFTPFIAEEIYKGVGGERESVHLEDWPEETLLDRFKDLFKGNLTHEMKTLREIASSALDARRRADMKVRQPLNGMQVKGEALSDELEEILLDEVNIKSVTFSTTLPDEQTIILDTVLTPELQREGAMRDLIRDIQQKRKEAGCKPDDIVKLALPKDGGMQEFEETIMEEVRASEITWTDTSEAQIV